MRGPVPPILWVGIGFLALFSLIQLFIGITNGHPELLVAVAIQVFIIFGLAYGRKWAYIVTIIFSLLGVGFTLAQGPVEALAVLIANSLVVIPVVLATRFFFPVQQVRGEQPPA